MVRVAFSLLGIFLAAWLLVPSAAADVEAPGDRLAAGVAALDGKPPNPTAARAAFEAVAAATDDRSAAEALYRLGQLDEAAYDFKAAVAHYEASANRLPSGRRAPHAQNRASDLRAHAEGDFVPLTSLERVRRAPERANDPATIDALVRESALFPAGRVRVEARMLAAEAYAGRLHRPADALPLLEQVIDDPKAEVLMAREATSELLAAYEAKQDYARAEAAIAAHPKLAPSGAEKAIRRLTRRRVFRYAALVDLGLLLAFGLSAVRTDNRHRAGRELRLLAPTALVFAAFATLGGGLLASRYEQTSPYPFTAMFPATFAVIMLARASSATGSVSGLARTGRAIASFLGVFAAAFLILDRMDPTYLAGFGL